MQQIADWLEKLGMSEYAQRFAENGIDVSVLRHLTDQDLEKVGVLLGHRRKMLAAIAELGGTAAAAPERKPQDIAERRQVTVMFSDLVGSTELAVRMDPEDLREVISAYQKCVAETVRRFDGFVAKYMGDGVLVYFGYPQAHEDDAERAVRAGLELVEATPKLTTAAGVPLPVRVGIATGLVVVGDLIGVGATQEQAIVGETPNIAARLQALAEPGAVMIAGSTRRLTGGLFEYRDLGTVALKGFAEKVPAWRVLEASAAESRFEALRATTTPLVGRDEEMDLLLRRWEQAKRGDGCVVLISGEPGIGKSRIAETIVERLGCEPDTRLRYFCSPHHQDSALYPSIAQLERAAGFRREDTAEQRLAKLEAVLAQGTNDLSEAVPLLADLLSIPTGDRYPPLNLTPQKRKEKTLHAQLAQLEGLAARQPVLMVWEDVHWSDPTTREVLDLLIDRVPRLRLLVIITFRPEFTLPWVGAHVTLLSLDRLPPRQCGEMITHLTSGKALPKDIAEQIIDRTDGVPLFIEELTKTVVESGIVTEAGDYAVAGPMAPLAIPTSLHASLLARLDRLAATREVVQIAAALGRQFSHELISAVAEMQQQQLDDALAQLRSAELIFRRGTPPDAEYTFKHALVQDAAYGTLLRGRRQQLHARIASTLESQFPDVVETQPELLGRHFGEGGFEEKAIAYFTVAGERAVKRGANAEVIRHFRRALELLQGRPETAERGKAELKVLEKLGPALAAAHGFGAPEIERTYLRARDLCEQLGEPVELFRALWGLWLATVGRERWEAARPIADELFAVAHRLDDRALLLEAHHAMCPTTLWVGNPQATRIHGEQGMRLYEMEQHRSLAFLFGGHDPGVCCRMHSGMALWFLGYPESALERSRTGLAMARELSHIGTIVAELPVGGIINQLCGDVVAVREIAESLTSLSTEHGFPQWLAFGNILNAWVQARSRGETARLRRAISEYRAANEQYVPYFLGLLAAIQLRYEELAEGLDTVVSALGLTGGIGSRLMDPELLRLKGELLIALDPGAKADAEVAFCQAIDIAQRQSSKSWELRAAMSMARLWRDQGKRDEARELLAPVYGWFTEGFDTLDLKEAKALLDELAS